MAALVFTLAKEGGFSEEMILEIPVYRVNSYYHAALRAHDVWTCTPSAPPTHQIHDLLAFLDTPQEEE